MDWRSRGTLRLAILATSKLATYSRPAVGTSSRSNSRRNVDLPEPEGPIRKTNSPLSISTVTSSNAGRVEVLYTLDTCSSRITRRESTTARVIELLPTSSRGELPVSVAQLLCTTDYW